MPFAIRDGVRLYWKLEGAPDRPVLLLLNSIGTDMGLWETALPYLLPHFQLLRMDTRGHGASDAPTGDYSLSMLALDAVAVMDSAGIAEAAVAGVSLGGMIAMQMALEHSDRVSALCLICTSATMDSSAWADRVEKVRAEGTAAIADLAMGRFLSARFVSTHGDIAAGLRSALVRMENAGYAGCGAAIRDMELIDHLAGVRLPTLIIVGDRDSSTPYVGHGDRLAATLRDAELVHIDAAHLAPVENPAALSTAITRFLQSKGEISEASDRLFAAGLVNRRRVLGDEWVDKSLANRTPFNADFQAMITRIAWKEIWGRPGLDDRTRRLIVIAITASLGRWEEFTLHVRAGLTRDGFTRDELKEVLMQTAIYAGVPAANTAFAEAANIIAEIDD